jgi:hypothetical protein
MFHRSVAPEPFGMGKNATIGRVESPVSRSAGAAALAEPGLGYPTDRDALDKIMVRIDR